MSSWQFSKNFPLPKNGGHFEFSNFWPKMEKQIASISLTMQDRVISSKFSTHRVSKKCTLCNFQKIFLSPKMVAILNFRSLPKMEKHKFASISLTVRDRAISLNFQPTGYLINVLLAIFKKIFSPQKWRLF